MIDNARDFLDSIFDYGDSGTTPPSSADRPVRLATVDAGFTFGLPRVLFDGETLMGLKGYAWNAAGGWDPSPGDRVFLVPAGTSYVIGGPIRTNPAFLRQIPLVPYAPNGWKDYDSSYAAANYNPATDKPAKFGYPRVTRSSSGWVIVTGLLSNAAGSTNGALVTSLPAGFRPLSEVSFSAHNNSNTASATVTVLVNGDIVISGTAGAGYLNLGQIAFNNLVVPIALPLQNSWVNFGSTTAPAAYAKDVYGLCYASGAIKSGTAATYGITPAGYRPALNRTTYGAQSTPNSMVGVSIDSSGNLFPQPPNTNIRRDLDGFHWAEASTEANYVNMVYLASASYNTAAYPPLSYYSRPDGLVHVRGMINTVAAGSVISILPVGLRPSSNIMRNTDSGDSSHRLDIYGGSGQIVLASSGASWASIDVLFAPEM